VIFECDFAQISKRCSLNIDLYDAVLSNLLLGKSNLAKIALLEVKTHIETAYVNNPLTYLKASHIFQAKALIANQQ
jgi:hypothetical protein